MSTTYRFIECPSEDSDVMTWFRVLKTEITEVKTPYGYVLYFKDFGALAYLPDGSIDADTSPVVTVVLPEIRRGILWTVGEVHFRAKLLRKQFPKLHSINKKFSEWLSELECVYSNKRTDNPYSYYLEGSAMNYDAPIYAFWSGILELKKERYFVSHADNSLRLETICKKLRLRGVNCECA